MTRIIAIANQKGGVGKTTTTVNLGASLSLRGLRVLLVDIDPQSSLSASLGIREPGVTVYDVLTGEPAQRAIIHGLGLDVIPATPDLAGAEMELTTIPGREYILSEALAGLDYDYILIDCPPALGLLTLNALTAATELLVPLQPEFLALDGLTRLLDTVELVQKRLNKGLKIAGVIVTRYDQRKRASREIVEMARASLGDLVIDRPIKENVSLNEAPGSSKHIFDYKPDSSGAADYAALADEIITRGQK